MKHETKMCAGSCCRKRKDGGKGVSWHNWARLYAALAAPGASSRRRRKGAVGTAEPTEYLLVATVARGT